MFITSFRQIINPEDGYWQYRKDDYKTYKINYIDNTDAFYESVFYFDVGWKKIYTTARFPDVAYIWFCNNLSTVYGNSDNGFVVNEHFLERISYSDSDANYPLEFIQADEKFTVDYSTIPNDLFSPQIIGYFDYLSRTYEDLEGQITKAGVNQMYSLGKAKFIDNQAYVFLWVKPTPGAFPSAIEISSTGYSCDELRDYFENKLEWKIYENSDWGFVVMIPNTDLQITVRQELFSAKVQIRKV